MQIRIHQSYLERILKLEENEILLGCDGQTYYRVDKEEDHFILTVREKIEKREG